MKKEMTEEDFSKHYPPTDGRIVSFPDPIFGFTYRWKESIPIAIWKKTKVNKILIKQDSQHSSNNGQSE